MSAERAPHLSEVAPGVWAGPDAHGDVTVAHARFPEVTFTASDEGNGRWRVDLRGPQGDLTMARGMSERDAWVHAMVCAERAS